MKYKFILFSPWLLKSPVDPWTLQDPNPNSEKLGGAVPKKICRRSL